MIFFCHLFFFAYIIGTMLKQEFLQRAHSVHGDRYGYDFVPDTLRVGDRIEVECPEHGVFIALVKDLLGGHGCPSCGKVRSASRRTWSTEKFVEEARKVHGDKYDYSKSVYVKQSVGVTITCPLHGDFVQTPRKHIRGQGCRKCGDDKKSRDCSIGMEEFVRRSKEKFGDKFDYSEVLYRNNKEKVRIKCPVHGWFEMSPSAHLNSKTGCRKCGCEATKARRLQSRGYIVSKSKEVHGDKYGYDNFDYVNWHTPSYVTCPLHGDFLVHCSNHISNKSGCPKCSHKVSRWEEGVLDFISSLGVECEASNRDVLGGMEIDIYLPQHRIGIECDGLRWHSELYRGKNFHLEKTDKCGEQGVRLIHIFEDEWIAKNSIWKSMIRNMLGLTDKKIYARNCKTRAVSSRDARAFLNENHIQGHSNSKFNYGLYHDGELVSLMTFGHKRINLGGRNESGHFELVRFCNKAGTNVVGGASKLLKHFVKENNPTEIVSYSDKRWSLGKLYGSLGFVHSHDSKPNYFYVKNGVRMNRFMFRKSVLVKDGFDKTKTEHDIMMERGIYRIYDCGTMVWKWRRDET